MNTNGKKIFTFFDFADKTPPYISLCLKTWKKNIPSDYQIIVLTPKNLNKYMPLKPNFLKLKHNFNFYLDYITANILFHNGGLFLDADTIITDKFYIPEILLTQYELLLYGKSNNFLCTGFLMANKNSYILKETLQTLEKSNDKNYQRNDALNFAIKNSNPNSIGILDCESCGYIMEKAMYGVFSPFLYQKHYFTDINTVDDFLKTTKGITALHNSLTDKKYKNMTEKEFLALDILLSKIFKAVL